MNRCQVFNQMVMQLCKELPNDYQQVEYLQSSGSQYLNIGAISNHQYFDIDFAYVSWVNNNYGNSYNFNGLLGCNNVSINGQRVDTKLSFASTPSIGGAICNTGISRVNITANTRYNLYLSPTAFKLDEQILNSLSLEEIVGTFNCYVFTCYVPSDPTPSKMSSAARIYHLKTSSINLYPCYRKSDNKPGMYDLVSGTFYTNAGSGEFTIGSAV